ncbi:MAG: hypothetical protein Q9223_003000 [Gallowayella weberi]
MSFGWSVSDVASLVQLAYRTAQGARAACGQYDELTRETSSLHIVLNRLHLEVAKPGNPINKQRGIGSYAQDFESIATGCEEALTLLDKILVKYSALSEQERSVRKLWQKVKFGNGAIINVAELKSKVAYYTSALSLFLNLVAVGTVGDVELKMDQAGGDLKEIKAAVNHITAHLLATERKERSVLTAYTNDDKDAWRELRRGLLRAGFRGSLVRKHMDTIMAYVKELGDEGVLDDIKTDEPASPLLEGYQGESSPLEGIQHLRSHTLDPDWQPGGDDLKGRPLRARPQAGSPRPRFPLPLVTVEKTQIVRKLRTNGPGRLHVEPSREIKTRNVTGWLSTRRLILEFVMNQEETVTFLTCLNSFLFTQISYDTNARGTQGHLRKI